MVAPVVSVSSSGWAWTDSSRGVSMSPRLCSIPGDATCAGFRGAVLLTGLLAGVAGAATVSLLHAVRTSRLSLFVWAPARRHRRQFASSTRVGTCDRRGARGTRLVDLAPARNSVAVGDHRRQEADAAPADGGRRRAGARRRHRCIARPGDGTASIGRGAQRLRDDVARAADVVDARNADGPRPRILLSCAAGAGLGAVYSVPLGGAFFAARDHDGHLAHKVVGTALITSSLAVAVSHPVHPFRARPHLAGSGTVDANSPCWRTTHRTAGGGDRHDVQPVDDISRAQPQLTSWQPSRASHWRTGDRHHRSTGPTPRATRPHWRA